MKKNKLLLLGTISAILLIIIIGGNAQAFGSPSPTTPPPPQTTTELPPPATTGLVEIRNIFYDGAGSSEPDEYVEIENDDSVPIQLKNWTLRDVANHIFTFPSFVIQPNQKCRVYTNQIHAQWCGFSYGSGSTIWNNTGYCLFEGWEWDID